jgi:hypothetical protein
MYGSWVRIPAEPPKALPDSGRAFSFAAYAKLYPEIQENALLILSI